MRISILVLCALIALSSGHTSVKRDVFNEFIRLYSDPNSSSKGVGRVEVKVNGEWGPICDEDWSFDDANVACEELGFIKALYEAKRSKHGSTSKKAVMTKVNCDSVKDHKMQDCEYSQDIPDSCTKERQAGVACLHEGLPQILRVGCYSDKEANRVMHDLYANYRDQIEWWNVRSMITKCAEVASIKGYKYFGIQFYGECWGSKNAEETFDDLGKSYNCIDGVGKHYANYVYRFAPWHDLGCWTDKHGDRTMEWIGSFRATIDWNDMPATVERCYNAAKAKNFKYFAVQFFGECWGSNDPESFKKHGQSVKCWGGTGHNLANYVYKVVE